MAGSPPSSLRQPAVAAEHSSRPGSRASPASPVSPPSPSAASPSPAPSGSRSPGRPGHPAALHDSTAAGPSTYPSSPSIPPATAAPTDTRAASGQPQVAFALPDAGAAGAPAGAAAGAAVGATAAAAADTQLTEKDGPKRSFWKSIDDAEQEARWKLGLRVILLIVDLIAIICIAAALGGRDMSNLTDYVMNTYTGITALSASLVVPCVSFLWCAVVLFVLLLPRGPNRDRRPVHPGVVVGFDLVLWLAFIISVLLATYDALGTQYLGYDNDLSDVDDSNSYSNGYEGHYTLAANGSWVYEITYTRATYSTYTYTSTYTNAYEYVYRRDADYANYAVPDSSLADVLALSTPTAAADLLSSSSLASQPAATALAVIVTPTPTPTPTPAPTASPDRPLQERAASDSSSSSYDPYSDYYDDYTTTTSTTRSTRLRTTTTRITPTPTRNCQPSFSSCAEQDTYVNGVWKHRNDRLRLDTANATCQGIALLLHFILFVWACVDTARRNRRRRGDVLTLDVLQNLQSRGYTVIPPPPNAYTVASPYPGNVVAYPMMPQPAVIPMAPYPVYAPGSGPVPAPAPVPGPLPMPADTKGKGPARYA